MEEVAENREARPFPASQVISYAHDVNDRIASIHRGASTASNKVAQFTYAGFGRTLSRSYFDGTASENEMSGLAVAYDGVNRVTQHYQALQDTTAVAKFDYAYDKVGNKLFEKKLHDTDASEVYTYDKLYRLASYKRGEMNGSNEVPSPLMEQSWTLDKVHNWTETAIPGGTQTRTHSYANALTGRNGPYIPDLFTTALYHFEDIAGSLT